MTPLIRSSSSISIYDLPDRFDCARLCHASEGSLSIREDSGKTIAQARFRLR